VVDSREGCEKVPAVHLSRSKWPWLVLEVQEPVMDLAQQPTGQLRCDC
jgi:hypothetical protein